MQSLDELLIDYIETPLDAVLQKKIVAFSYEDAQAGKYGPEWFHVKLLDDNQSYRRGESGRANQRNVQHSRALWVVGGFAVKKDTQDAGLARIAGARLIETMTGVFRALGSSRGMVGSTRYSIISTEIQSVTPAFRDGDTSGLVMFDLSIKLMESR